MRLCLVLVAGFDDPLLMMTITASRPTVAGDESSLEAPCSVCGNVRLAMIDDLCVSCVLDGMGAGAGNLMPRVYKPTSRERFDGGVLSQEFAS